ncbi:MAG: hypothetical protein RBU21_09505 [FCB group bacterium]|jgi:hypothetical protein|nr:hypothetical protein [FCB group bacterium]
MRKILGCLVLAVLVSTLGCARAARDTSGFAMTDSAVVNAPLEQTWTATREVLQDHKLEIYTRDKRGRFVAYSDMNRQLMLVPHRQEYTITLEPQDSSTKVTIQTLRQVYGVTLLTYPDWHARKTSDNAEAVALLQDIQAKATGQEPTAPAAEAPAEETGNKG